MRATGRFWNDVWSFLQIDVDHLCSDTRRCRWGQYRDINRTILQVNVRLKTWGSRAFLGQKQYIFLSKITFSSKGTSQVTIDDDMKRAGWDIFPNEQCNLYTSSFTYSKSQRISQMEITDKKWTDELAKFLPVNQVIWAPPNVPTAGLRESMVGSDIEVNGTDESEYWWNCNIMLAMEITWLNGVIKILGFIGTVFCTVYLASIALSASRNLERATRLLRSEIRCSSSSRSLLYLTVSLTWATCMSWTIVKSTYRENEKLKAGLSQSPREAFLIHWYLQVMSFTLPNVIRAAHSELFGQLNLLIIKLKMSLKCPLTASQIWSDPRNIYFPICTTQTPIDR